MSQTELNMMWVYSCSESLPWDVNVWTPSLSYNNKSPQTFVVSCRTMTSGVSSQGGAVFPGGHRVRSGGRTATTSFPVTASAAGERQHRRVNRSITGRSSASSVSPRHLSFFTQCCLEGTSKNYCWHCSMNNPPFHCFTWQQQQQAGSHTPLYEPQTAVVLLVHFTEQGRATLLFIMSHYKGTKSPFILTTQQQLW